MYKVRHRTEGCFAALKVIDKKDTAKGEPRVLTSLKREIGIHRPLKNEHVVQYLTCFEDSSNFYILLEYCDRGEMYLALQREKRFAPEKVRDYGLQLAKGVDYLHALGVVHRDLKLGNLFLTSTNVLVPAAHQKIGDFGLAVKLEQPCARDPLGPVGTPNYIAPEMLTDNLNSKALDIWAFGVILLTLATGKLPFDVDASQ